MPKSGDDPAALPRRALRWVGRAALKALGGAVYYAIYRELPNPNDPDPYWREMHPDQDKGTGRDGGDFEPPPGI
jgi:hypothetical protein